MRIFFLCLIMTLLIGCDNFSPNIALGTLERDRIVHTATINEVIVELPITPGSQVKKGVVLVRLNDTFQTAQVAKAKAQVLQAEIHLEKLVNGAREEEIAASRARVAGAKAQLVQSQAQYKRQIEIAKLDLNSQSDVDGALAKRDSDQAFLDSSLEQLRELIRGTRSEDLRMAEANLVAIKAAYDAELKKLADLTITATRDGILDNLPWNLGERVTTGSPVAIVIAGQSPYARVYIPEPYRVNIHPGSQFMVHIDGIEQPILGTVKWISNDPAFTPYYALNQQERSRLMYLAEVQLPDSAAHLPNGVPVQVELP